MNTATKSNIINLPSAELQAAYLNAFAGLRALSKVIAKMDAAKNAANKDWNAQIKDAEENYRGPMREEFESIVGVDLSAKGKTAAAVKQRYAEKFVEAVKGLRQHADIKSQKAADMAERQRRIDVLVTARMECEGVSTSDQMPLVWDGETDDMPGMAWASSATRQAIWTSLRELERDKVTLDPYQTDLLMALAGVDLEELELGLDAAEAVEQDDGEEADEWEDDEDVLSDDDLDEMGLD